MQINFGGNQLSSSKYEELLGILLDNKLTFENRLLNIVNKVNQKIHALARISKHMSQKKLRITMKAFVTSQFGYCPLIWMFHSRRKNHKINNLHERALRIVYKDNFSSFEELLPKDKSVGPSKKSSNTWYWDVWNIKWFISRLCKTFLKPKETTVILIMRQHLPKEVLK